MALSKPLSPLALDIENLYKNVPKVQEVFNVKKKIGYGAFSSVYLATLRNHPEIKEEFALKHIKPTSHPSRIARELKCLQQIGGSDYVMGVKTCIREEDHVVIVLPYFPHDRFKDYVQSISPDEVKSYMKALLTALKKVHEHDIIHRDVNPGNFLYNRKTRQFALVDFGLAMKAPKPLTTDSNIITTAITKPNDMKTIESPLLAKRVLEMRQDSLFEKSSDKNQTSLVQKTASEEAICTSVENPTCECMGKAQICSVCMARPDQIAPRAGTPGFRAPEVLLKYTDQSTALDVWSAGVVFMSLLSGRFPFFKAADDITALCQIISIFGTVACADAARCIGKELTCSSVMPPQNLRTMCESLRGLKPKPKQHKGAWYYVPDSAYDLLQKLLDLNPLTRITAEDALKHPFFDV